MTTAPIIIRNADLAKMAIEERNETLTFHTDVYDAWDIPVIGVELDDDLDTSTESE